MRVELKAFAQLKSGVQSAPGSDEWVLLTNLAFSVTHQLQSDEIDTVAIGPPGVRVVEVKHWTFQWVDLHKDLVEQEAERLTNKARKIGTALRRIVPDLPYVEGADPAHAGRVQGEAARRDGGARGWIPYPERLEGCHRL